MPGSQFNPMPNDRPGELERRIRDLERLVMEQAGARTLENATIGAGGLTIQGGKLYLKDTLGNLLATFDATGLNVSGTENVSGTLNVTGNTVIGGTLSLPNGIINNAALSNPVTPGVVNLYVSFFGLPFPGYAEIAGVDLTVPAGCTSLLFDGDAAIDCYNSKTTGGNNGSGGDYIYAQVRIGSSTSPGNWATGVSGNNGNATATRSYAQLITGLTPGATIRASVYGSSDYGIASNSGNLASLSATLIWLR